MGETAEATLKEIAQTRADLEHDIDELFARLPSNQELAARARTYGGAAAGALVVVAMVVLRLKARSERRARRTEARINAEELARAFSPHPPREDDTSSSRSGVVALVIALVALGVGVANTVRSRDDG